MLLGIILFVTTVPYVVAFALKPLATICVVGFMAYFQVLMAFATSTNTDTAHAIRFLLAGSNPIGMTGASSLLFGAVDSVLDWREDSGERRRRTLTFLALTVYKLMMTPIGVVLMITEYAWDAIAMRRPKLVPQKWRELFSLARYHDLICPEKSNDIFYADLAFARYQQDPMLYQWARLRAMVFELQHYHIDEQNSVGVAATNLFLQTEYQAYQTLKRLRLESIEQQVAKHYSERIEEFPFPENVARRLVQNARPVGHYLRMRESSLMDRAFQCDFDRDLSSLLGERDTKCYASWFVLRLLDEPVEVYSPAASDYLDQKRLLRLVEFGVLEQQSDFEFRFSKRFFGELQDLVQEHFRAADAAEAEGALAGQIPDLLSIRGDYFVPRS